MVIACIISFVAGALMMMCAIGMVAIQKDKKPRNKVRFFVVMPRPNHLFLYLSEPIRSKNEYETTFCARIGGNLLACDNYLADYGLCLEDFADMRPGDIREVFLNLED